MIEMARSMLKQMHLPSTFWGEAVRHTIYILNHLPTRAISGMTPFIAWFEKKPTISHIRVFGCLAYMRLPSGSIKKLED